jgi:cell division protein ZapA
VNRDSGAVKVYILDKEFLVACPEEDRDALQASAKYLNDRMLEIRGSGRVVGIDRIAVMAALNLAHEVVESGGESKTLDGYAARIGQLNARIEETIARQTKKELN